MEHESVYFKCLVFACVVVGGFAHSIQYSTDSNNTSDLLFHTLTSEDYTDQVKVDFPIGGNDSELTDQSTLDAWSIVWYVASFGGLILFFLIVSCSEWCCRRNARRRCQHNAPTLSGAEPETPPPSYDLFAPPSYEDLWGASGAGMEKRQYDVYVVPVHALGNFMEGVNRNEAPPPYPTPSGTDRVT